MKILFVSNFSNSDHDELTEEKFYERYETTSIDLEDYKDDPDWEILYVTDDPFMAEIWDKIEPLVDNDLEGLREQVLNAKEEI